MFTYVLKAKPFSAFFIFYQVIYLLGDMELKKIIRFCLFLALLLVLVACNEDNTDKSNKNNEKDSLTPITFVLDWTPNTNHTGMYVAREKGYFKDQGLDVEFILPGEVGAEQLIASNKADFGVSYQERVIMARSEGLPLVSLAAVIQHNTAGYMSPVDRDITTPNDFEDKRFGGIGVPIQEAMMQTIMDENNADIEKVNVINIGDSDFFTAIKRDVDFATVFYAWTGIEAEIRDLDMNMMYYIDVAEGLDFYTPVLATSEKVIEKNPKLVEAFIHAASKGYAFAIENPAEAADILIKSEPDLDPELVKKSQEWLASRYQDDAEVWGLQELKRWDTVIDFMFENKIIDQDIEANPAFTTEFLPK